MIKFSTTDLLVFFETEPEADSIEPAILRYSVTTSSNMKLVFTIDDPLSCVHVLLSSDGVALVDVGSEGVTEVKFMGRGDKEILECTVDSGSFAGKLSITWKAVPHLRSCLLAV